MSRDSYNLNSQSIRDMVMHDEIILPEHISKETVFEDSVEVFSDSAMESRIQGASYEPRIGKEVYILDQSEAGIFRPRVDKSIADILKENQKLVIDRLAINNQGFEVKTNGIYLFKLEECVDLLDTAWLRSWPKSSNGREFARIQLYADYTDTVDEIRGRHPSKKMQLYLLWQPETFGHIVYPGEAVNQLRIFEKWDVKLSGQEILDRHEQDPLLYVKNHDTDQLEAIPYNEFAVTDALQLRVDLSGKGTNGIVGLRAKHNPTAVDMKNLYDPKTAKGGHDPLAYFAPVMAPNGEITLSPGEHYLLFSKEYLRIPPDLPCELHAFSGVGVRGEMHRAGFIDPGFGYDPNDITVASQLVFEVCNSERDPVTLVDGNPMSKLDFFHVHAIPDKVYGSKAAKSNYQGQDGVRVSKRFKPLNYVDALKRATIQ